MTELQGWIIIGLLALQFVVYPVIVALSPKPKPVNHFAEQVRKLHV